MWTFLTRSELATHFRLCDEMWKKNMWILFQPNITFLLIQYSIWKCCCRVCCDQKSDYCSWATIFEMGKINDDVSMVDCLVRHYTTSTFFVVSTMKTWWVYIWVSRSSETKTKTLHWMPVHQSMQMKYNCDEKWLIPIYDIINSWKPAYWTLFMSKKRKKLDKLIFITRLLCWLYKRIQIKLMNIRFQLSFRAILPQHEFKIENNAWFCT